jgi:hypothetical protein
VLHWSCYWGHWLGLNHGWLRLSVNHRCGAQRRAASKCGQAMHGGFSAAQKGQVGVRHGLLPRSMRIDGLLLNLLERA